MQRAWAPRYIYRIYPSHIELPTGRPRDKQVPVTKTFREIRSSTSLNLAHNARTRIKSSPRVQDSDLRSTSLYTRRRSRALKSTAIEKGAPRPTRPTCSVTMRVRRAKERETAWAAPAAVHRAVTSAEKSNGLGGRLRASKPLLRPSLSLSLSPLSGYLARTRGSFTLIVCARKRHPSAPAATADNTSFFTVPAARRLSRSLSSARF